MNKVVFTITLVAACIAVSTAAPGPSIKVINWTEVAAKVGEIEAVVSDTLDQVQSIANTDNEAVGGSIAVKIEAAVVNATALLEQANVAIADQSLTEGQARALTGSLKATIGRLSGSLEADLAQLSPAVGVQIRQLLAASFTSVEVKAQELAVLLRQ